MDWLKLENDTFVWINEKSALLFNPEKGRHLFTEMATPEIEYFFRFLADPGNLCCIKLDALSSKEGKIHPIIERIIDHHLGMIISASEPPVSYPPVLNLQCDPVRMTYRDNAQEGMYWNTYLKEVVLFFTGSLDLDKDNIFKQVIYPLEGLDAVPIHPTLNFFNECLKIGIETITVCAIPDRHPDEALLLDYFRNVSVRKRLFVRDSDLTPEKMQRYGEIFDEINIIYHNNFDLFTNFSNSTYPVIKKRVLVDNEKDFEECLRIIKNKEDIYISPLAKRNNKEFFYNNVLLTHSEILGQKLEKRIIFARQRTNLNHFGILNILPNGNVYSNLFEQPVGTIQDSIQSIIAREMESKKGWFETRDKLPCRHCVCRWLCPSPTSYERLLNCLACAEGGPLTKDDEK